MQSVLHKCVLHITAVDGLAYQLSEYFLPFHIHCSPNHTLWTSTHIYTIQKLQTIWSKPTVHYIKKLKKNHTISCISTKTTDKYFPVKTH